MNDVLPHSMRRNRRKFLGGRVDRRTPLFINLTHAWVCIVLGKGCPPVRRQPLPSILRLAFTSSNPLSLTIHPRVPLFPIRLLWKPACCSTIPKRLILIGFLILPQETSLSEISAVVMNRPSSCLFAISFTIVIYHVRSPIPTTKVLLFFDISVPEIGNVT